MLKERDGSPRRMQRLGRAKRNHNKAEKDIKIQNKSHPYRFYLGKPRVKKR